MKLSIRKQLLGAFAILILILMGIGMFLMSMVKTENANLAELYLHGLQPMRQISAANFSLQEQRIGMLRAMLSKDAKFSEDIAVAQTAMKVMLDSLVAGADQATTEELKQFASGFEEWAGVRDRQIAMAAGGDLAGAIRLMTEKGALLYAAQAKILTDLEERVEANGHRVRDIGNAEYKRTLIISWIILALAIVGSTLLGFVVARKITRPLSETVRVLDQVAEGDLTPRIEVRSHDELGQMGQALNTALDSLSAAMGSIAQNAHSLASSSEELSAVSTQMGSNATETSAQANLVSAAAEQVSKNVQTVATGTEEMTASIREIAKNASEAAKVASSAVRVAEMTNASVAKLGVSSAEIGNVVKVITSIAQQTNLLALNATIEAARAGEAGKGFAVVANEVKELAKETAKATEDISRKIEAIQSDTQAAVEAIGQIGAIISQINDAQNTIASAVEEQTATTNEMARNVEEASKGSSEIAQNITVVAQAAESTTSGATDTQTAAGELARMAAELQSIVSRFQVRSASTVVAIESAAGPLPNARYAPPRRGGEKLRAAA